MATVRERIIQAVAYKVAVRNFEAWVNERGEKTEDMIAAEAAAGMPMKWVAVGSDSMLLNEIVEGYCLGQGKVYAAYYLNINDQQYKRLANAILKCARVQELRRQDVYLFQKDQLISKEG